ncbi:MAG: hypothetical protein H8D54_00890 [Candidatus Omnitrophica bacterium]|nr:hypothetical protein [Candidatus Omnitrophota bacterium]
MSKTIKKMDAEEKKVIDTIEDLLLAFVLDKFEIATTYWKPIQDNYQKIKDAYTGTSTIEEKSTDANINVPILKKVVRNKVAHYAEMLLSRGAESFDLEPGEIEDETNSENLRLLTVYHLNNAEVERKVIPWLWNYENYGYGVLVVPWKLIEEKQKVGEGKDGKDIYKDVVLFDGPDIENADVITFLSDPYNKDLTSWKIFPRDNVPATYLRQKEKEGIFTNIKELKDTSYPDFHQQNPLTAPKDSVELLEYHGLVPQRLIEGKLNDTIDINPFEEDYVWAIITIANREKVIRAAKYPYWCGNIFVPVWKDKLTGENKGIGTGEDLQALVPMLTNLYNRVTNIVNQISNNMYEVVVDDYIGNPKTIKTRPGKVFPVKRIGTVKALDTTAQAAALSPLYQILTKTEKLIEELTSTPPQIMPTGDKEDIHSTASGLMAMQQQAMLPIQTGTKNDLEPAFKKVLEIFYKHNIQFFKKANAVRVLGKDKAKEMNLTNITMKDIVMKGNPDFIPTGVSGFIQKSMELKNLMAFLEVALKAQVPGQTGEDGKPILEMVVDIREIIIRIADQFMFKDPEKLIPSLKKEREEREFNKKKQKMLEEMKEMAKKGKSRQNEGVIPVSREGGTVSSVSPSVGGQASGAKGEV